MNRAAAETRDETTTHTVQGAGCGASCGITQSRARQQQRARELAQRAYPALVWSETATWSPSVPPVGADELAALAEHITEVIPARRLVLPTEDSECDGLHLLLGERETSVLEAMRSSVCGPVHAGDETVLRVLVSPLGRYFTLQEVRARAERDDAGVWLFTEHMAGLHDKRMQWMVKAVQGLLRKHHVIALDAGFLTQPAVREDGTAGATWWELLFEPQSPLRHASAFVPNE
jgi:hypothetical protein